MKKTFTIYLLFLSFYSQADSWTQKADFGGTARHAATGFFLNGKGYIGTGGDFMIRKKDFWEWDPTTDAWTQKADFGGTARSGAVGFAIGSLGYIATGFDNSLRKDMWAYNPATNTWTQKTDFGGAARHYAVGFELNGMGYIGTGYGTTDYKDFWQYNPSTNTWTQKANLGGSARSTAVGFSVNGKGYIGTGYGALASSDFWEYDPSANTWTQKAAFGGGGRSSGIGFGLCGKGYLGMGMSSSGTDKKDLWEYDPVSNAWTQKADCGGPARENAVAFSDGTYGYIGTGYYFQTITYQIFETDDFWQYTPDCTILPIELTSFTARQQGDVIKLQWTTESEINNNYFTVEKSQDGIHFETLCAVKGNGNSSAPINYETEDVHPFNGLNYYRLKQTDFDSSYTYSNVVSCLSGGNGIKGVISVTPNPVQSFAAITLDLTDDQEVSVQLLDTRGQSVFDKIFFVEKGIQHLDINLSGLKEGIYILRVYCEHGSFSQKLLKLN